jgi:hypothetical protein
VGGDGEPEELRTCQNTKLNYHQIPMTKLRVGFLEIGQYGAV